MSKTDAENTRDTTALQSASLMPANLQALTESIDTVVESALPMMRNQRGGVGKALMMSVAVNRLRELVTPAIVQQHIIPLQNTTLGFLTDQKAGYDVETVRNVTVEALLRGLRMVDNEVNIIAGRFYAARNGLARLVETWPGLTDLRMQPETPAPLPPSGAAVPFVASWKLDGVADKIECVLRKGLDGREADNRIPVRVNTGMIVDAILGKAYRKMYAMILRRLSGARDMPEGEVGDIEVKARERGTLTPEALSESAEPNRGHGQEGFPPAPKRSRTVAEAFAADAAETGTP